MCWQKAHQIVYLLHITQWKKSFCHTFLEPLCMPYHECQSYVTIYLLRPSPKSKLRSSVPDLVASFIRVVLEVLVEELAKLRDLVFEFCTTSPALFGVKKLVGNVCALPGDAQIEYVVCLVLCLC